MNVEPLRTASAPAAENATVRRPSAFLALGLVLGCVLWSWVLYRPTLEVPFLLDDFVAGPILAPEPPLPSLLHKVLWPSDDRFDFHHHLRPVGWLSFALDVRLFGLEASSMRLVAILLHGLTGAGLALFALYALRVDLRAAALGGAFFIAHGASVEVVVWVCQRFTLLSTLFLVVALISAFGYARGGRRSSFLLAGFAAALALFSKDSGLALLGIVPAFVWLTAAPATRWPRALRMGASIAAVIAANLLLRHLATGSFLPKVDTGPGGGALERLDPTALFAQMLALIAPLSLPAEAPALAAALRWIFGAVTVAALMSVLLRRGPWIRWALLGLLVLVSLASWPQPMSSDGSLGGSRAVSLGTAILGLLLALGSPGWPRALALAALCLQAGANRWNQIDYDAARILTKDVAALVERAGASGERVLLDGLPATIGAAPLFAAATHVPIAFQRPFCDPPRDVQMIDAEGLDLLAAEPSSKPSRYLPMRLDRSAVRLLPAQGVRLPSDAERAATNAFRWVHPGGQDPAVFPDPTTGERLVLEGVALPTDPQGFLLRLEVGPLVIARRFALDDPLQSYDRSAQRLVITLPVAALASHPKVQAFLATGSITGLVGTLEVEALPEALSSSPLEGSAPLAIRIAL